MNTTKDAMMKKIMLISLLFLAFFTLNGADQDKAPPLFEQPLLITSAGQGAEVQLASVLAKKAGLDSVLSKAATAKDLEKVQTLALVMGASLKGLGAAGLNTAKEKERLSALVEEAKRKNIPVLCLHLMGESRRGQLSDEFITAFLPYAKMAIVVRSGNKDGLFTRICQEHSIPLVEVEKAADVLAPLQEAFK